MAFEDDVKAFEKKAKHKFSLQEFEHIIRHETKGFIGFIVNFNERTLVVTKLYGDGLYWIKGCLAMMKDLAYYGVNRIYYTTFRNPKAFCKLLGGTVDSTMERDQGTLYCIYSDYDSLKEAIDRRENKCRE